MNKFIIDSINIITEKQISDDTFYAQVHCEIEKKDSEGGEAFIAEIVSPKYFDEYLCQDENIEFGRGYIITRSFNHKNIIQKIQKMINSFNADSWEVLWPKINIYFNWIE